MSSHRRSAVDVWIRFAIEFQPSKAFKRQIDVRMFGGNHTFKTLRRHAYDRRRMIRQR